MKSLYKKYLFNLAINPFTYIFSCGMCLFCSLNFFLGQRFFSGFGNSDLHYFFSSIPLACILFVPAIVSFVQERGQNLLPFSDIKIYSARIFSEMTVAFAVIFVLTIVPVTVSFFGNIELSQLFCGYLGIILFLIFSFTAVEFIFSLIKSSTAGFVVSSLVLVVFNSVHNLPLFINLPLAFSEICKFISFAWHFDSFAKGLLDSRDITFFISLSVFFFASGIFVCEKRRGLSNRVFTHIRIITLITSVLLIALSFVLNFKIDTTSSKKYSVSKYSKTLVKEIEDKLYINYYLSPELKKLYPQIKDVNDYLEEFASASKNIIYVQENAAKPSVQKKLVIQNIPFQQLESSSTNSAGYTNVYSAITLNYLGKTQLIPFAMNTSNLEYDLDLRLSSLLRNEEHNVQVLVGNNLDFDSDYAYVEPWLKSMGINVLRLNLPFKPVSDMPLIVLGTSSFTKEDCFSFENFILSGGKAFVATQPYTVDLQNDWSVTESEYNFTRQLFTFGIYFNENLTADISNFRLSLISNSSEDGSKASSQSENVNYSLWPVLQSQSNAKKGLTLFWPCGMTLDNEIADMINFAVEPFLLSSKQSWNVKKIDGSYITNPFAVQKFPDSKDEFLTTVFAAAAYRKNASGPSLIVTGDQYAFSTGMINYSSSSSQNIDTRSLEYLTDCYFNLTGNQKLVEVKNKTQFDFSLNKISQSDFMRKAVDSLLFNFIFPVVIFSAAGIFVLIRRRKNNNEEI